MVLSNIRANVILPKIFFCQFIFNSYLNYILWLHKYSQWITIKHETGFVFDQVCTFYFGIGVRNADSQWEARNFDSSTTKDWREAVHIFIIIYKYAPYWIEILSSTDKMVRNDYYITSKEVGNQLLWCFNRYTREFWISSVLCSDEGHPFTLLFDYLFMF